MHAGRVRDSGHLPHGPTDRSLPLQPSPALSALSLCSPPLPLCPLSPSAALLSRSVRSLHLQPSLALSALCPLSPSAALSLCSPLPLCLAPRSRCQAPPRRAALSLARRWNCRTVCDNAHAATGGLRLGVQSRVYLELRTPYIGGSLPCHLSLHRSASHTGTPASCRYKRTQSRTGEAQSS